jgi:hypothetical protein
MHCGHCIGVGSLAGYIGETMDGPPLCLAFVIVKEFVVPAIFFYLESATNKRKGGDHLNLNYASGAFLTLFLQT